MGAKLFASKFYNAVTGMEWPSALIRASFTADFGAISLFRYTNLDNRTCRKKGVLLTAKALLIQEGVNTPPIPNCCKLQQKISKQVYLARKCTLKRALVKPATGAVRSFFRTHGKQHDWPCKLRAIDYPHPHPANWKLAIGAPPRRMWEMQLLTPFIGHQRLYDLGFMMHLFLWHE